MSLDTSLVSDWPMGATTDLVGANTITTFNAPAAVTGLDGNAYQLVRGSNQYLQLPAAMLGTIGDWAIEIWFKPTATDLSVNWPRVFDFGPDTSNYLMVSTKGGRELLGVMYGELAIAGAAYPAPLPTVLSADVWHQLVVTATNGRAAIFIDGTCVSGLSYGVNAQGSSVVGGAARNYFGCSQFAGDPLFDGLLDQGRLWSRALSPEEVTALYNGGTPLPNASLAGATIPPAPTPNANGRAPYQFFNFDGGAALVIHESYDGIYWTHYTPTYTPTVGSVRDPSGMVFPATGNWWVVHTPGGTSARYVSLAEANSAALTAWTYKAQIDTSAVVPVGGFSLAPEWVRNEDGSVWTDPVTGCPSVLFAGGSSTQTDFQIYETHPTTSDDSLWGNPANWSTPVALAGTALTTDMIDPYLIQIGTTWYLFFCDATQPNFPGSVRWLTSSARLTGFDTISGTDPCGFNNSGKGAEGPVLFKIGGKYRVYAEANSQSVGNLYAETTDFVTFTNRSGVSTDALLQHGTVVYAPSSTAYSFAPSGGLVGGGTSSPATTYHTAPSGGLVAGGLAGVVAAYQDTPSGGLVGGGQADVATSGNSTYTPSGGLVGGGTSAVTTDYHETPAGGLVGGGTADLIRQASFAPSGGLIGGGQASWTAGYAAAPDGGLVGGGSAGILWSATFSPSGGLIGGGAATAVFVLASSIAPTHLPLYWSADPTTLYWSADRPTLYWRNPEDA